MTDDQKTLTLVANEIKTETCEEYSRRMSAEHGTGFLSAKFEAEWQRGIEEFRAKLREPDGPEWDSRGGRSARAEGCAGRSFALGRHCSTSPPCARRSRPASRDARSGSRGRAPRERRRPTRRPTT